MIVVDTGPLVAAANERDDHHQHCLDYLETAPGPLIVPAPVVIEVCYFLGLLLPSPSFRASSILSP